MRKSMTRWIVATAAFTTLLLSSCGEYDQAVVPLPDRTEKDIISYFQEIALGFEDGNASPVIRKWQTDMVIYYAGEQDPVVRAELKLVTEELNAMFTDGFSIKVTGNGNLANCTIYTGPKSSVKSLFPDKAPLLRQNAGFFMVGWDSTNAITNAFIFIDAISCDSTTLKHLVREELTQSLGLGNDSCRHNGSIFQQSWTNTTDYSDLDRTLIRLLYSPGITPGLTSSDLTPVISQLIRAQ